MLIGRAPYGGSTFEFPARGARQPGSVSSRAGGPRRSSGRGLVRNLSRPPPRESRNGPARALKFSPPPDRFATAAGPASSEPEFDASLGIEVISVAEPGQIDRSVVARRRVTEKCNSHGQRPVRLNLRVNRSGSPRVVRLLALKVECPVRIICPRQSPDHGYANRDGSPHSVVRTGPQLPLRGGAVVGRRNMSRQHGAFPQRVVGWDTRPRDSRCSARKQDPNQTSGYFCS